MILNNNRYGSLQNNISNPYNLFGQKHKVEIESKYFTDPVVKVKERLLDWFCEHTVQSRDPFVRIEVRTERLFD